MAKTKGESTSQWSEEARRGGASVPPLCPRGCFITSSNDATSIIVCDKTMEQNDLGIVLYVVERIRRTTKRQSEGGSMLSIEQRKIVSAMLPKGSLVGDVVSTLRTVDSFGTVSVTIPSATLFAKAYFVGKNGQTFAGRIPLKRRVYMDRIGAFEYGKDGDREYFARF